MVSALFLTKEARFPTYPETLSAYSESEYSSTVVSLDNARPTPGPVRPTRPLLSKFSAPRKPVIYLYPPSRLPEVTVELLLTSSWSFSAIYPCEKQTTAQSFTWTVEAEPDGRLVDKTTGAEVTYLYWEATYVILSFVARPRLTLLFSGTLVGFSSANSRPVTPDASRATTPEEEDFETFDPLRPSLSPSDSILLPIGKVPIYLDAALKALTLHTEARTSFITYASSLLPPSLINFMSETLFFLFLSFFLIFIALASNSSLKLPSGELFFKYFRGGWVIRAWMAGHHADIGCRVYSNTNTSPCDSSRSHRTKRRLRCASRPRLTSSPVSSCCSVESAQTMWYFGLRRLLALQRRTARHSGRMSSASMGCARPIARCSEFWSGVGWKSNEYESSGRFGPLFLSFLLRVHAFIRL